MQQEMQIKYMKMPVTKEQKRALNLQGFQVVDAKFAPDDYVFDEPEEVKPIRQRRSQRDED